MHIGCCQDVDSKIKLDKYADKPFDDRMGNTLNLTGIVINQLRISHILKLLRFHQRRKHKWYCVWLELSILSRVGAETTR